jgi:hypothetical protein
MEARVLGKAAGSVTLAPLNSFIEKSREYYAFKACALESVTSGTFVGLDKETQAEIDASAREARWQIAAITPDGRKVLAQSVLFEACDDEDLKGGALLVTDIGTGEVLLFEPLGTYTSGGKTFPAWAMFLWPKRTDELFGYSGCTECGDLTRVYYDVTRKRLYTEYNGH